jgi:hypothetical protein
MPQNLGLRCEAKDLSGNPKKHGPKSECSHVGGQCGARSFIAKMRILHIKVRE